MSDDRYTAMEKRIANLERWQAKLSMLGCGTSILVALLATKVQGWW